MAEPDIVWVSDLVRQLAAQPDAEGVWECVVQASVSQVPGAEHGGITLLTNKSALTLAASSPLVRRVDHHQYATGEGPCLTAALQLEPIVRVADLATDARWPQFSSAAVELGIRSMLSLQLYTDTGTLGSLNLYAAVSGAFTDDSVRVGSLLAAHGAVAAAASMKRSHLLVAVQSRDIIGQAKGILMNRHKISAEQAFQLLVAASQRRHLKLKDVAAKLAETGEMPTGLE